MFLNFIIDLLISATSIGLTAWLLPGVSVKSIGTSVLVALVLGLLNAFVKPLLTLISLPVTILTLGLFMFVINAVIILLASKLLSGFQVEGFWWALLFSIIVTMVSSVLYALIGKFFL